MNHFTNNTWRVFFMHMGIKKNCWQVIKSNRKIDYNYTEIVSGNRLNYDYV